MKLQDVRMQWTSGAACPYDSIEATFHIKLKNGKMYFSNGNIEIEIKKDALINIFTPINCEWDEVEFNEPRQLRK
jgi:hypothetical protein